MPSYLCQRRASSSGLFRCAVRLQNAVPKCHVIISARFTRIRLYEFLCFLGGLVLLNKRNRLGRPSFFIVKTFSPPLSSFLSDPNDKSTRKRSTFEVKNRRCYKHISKRFRACGMNNSHRFQPIRYPSTRDRPSNMFLSDPKRRLRQLRRGIKHIQLPFRSKNKRHVIHCVHSLRLISMRLRRLGRLKRSKTHR